MVAVTHHAAESLDPAQCFELLERICASNELRRAARLREFLRYVGHRSLDGEHAIISEHEIGVHVFGRQKNYDTSADNIVRVNASELRKRIAAYYASEGAKETILIDIPRGSYTPVFTLRHLEPEVQAEPPEPASVLELHGAGPESPARTPSPFWKWARRYASFALIVVLALATAYYFHQARVLRDRFYGWKSEPALGPFWSGILDSPRQTDVVVADTSVALVEDVLKQRITLNDYLNHGYIQQIQSSDLSPDLKTDLEVIASRSNGSLGDFRVAQKILAFDPDSGRTHLQFAREYRPRAVQADNVILIGSSRSNPWCKLFENRLNFTLDYNPELNEMLVENRHPLLGESPTYGAPVDPSSSTGFSIIDYIPNDDRSADVLIVAGTTSEATEAAGDFLTSEDSLQRFEDRLRIHTLPYFELLLKTTKLVGTPLDAEVIAYRTFPGRALSKQ
ncbi:MAG TPA: hypothetical protein VMA34_16550 [Terracidiphilus sp.]|nr:hypothetical protein [Terracidiphilus sp.]